MTVDAAPVFAPGIYGDIPNEVYQASAGVSCSMLKRFAEAPAKARVRRPESKALTEGTLSHTALLEPHALEARYCVSDLKSFDARHEAYKAEAERAQGRVLVKRKDYEEALAQRDAVLAHPVAREMLAPGLMIEQSAYWHDAEAGLLCRGRLDGWRPEWRAIIDVKTTMDAAHRAFSRDAAKFRYPWQAAIYSDGWEAAGGGLVEAFLFLAIEKDPPFLIQVYELDPLALEAGRRQARDALVRFAECSASNVWPGYSETIERLHLPEWVMA